MAETEKQGTIEIASILSARTREGMVEITINGTKAQLDLPKAREVLGMLSGAIEASVSDMLVWRFMSETFDLSDEQTASILLNFRAMRQGSTGTVFPV